MAAQDRLDGQIDELRNLMRDLPHRSLSGTNQINMRVEAGGFGVMVCAVLAAFATSVSFAVALWTLSLSGQIGDLNAYLQAIYAQAPQLQPKDDKHGHPDDSHPSEKADQGHRSGG